MGWSIFTALSRTENSVTLPKEVNQEHQNIEIYKEIQNSIIKNVDSYLRTSRSLRKLPPVTQILSLKDYLNLSSRISNFINQNFSYNGIQADYFPYDNTSFINEVRFRPVSYQDFLVLNKKSLNVLEEYNLLSDATVYFVLTNESRIPLDLFPSLKSDIELMVNSARSKGKKVSSKAISFSLELNSQIILMKSYLNKVLNEAYRNSRLFTDFSHQVQFKPQYFVNLKTKTLILRINVVMGVSSI